MKLICNENADGDHIFEIFYLEKQDRYKVVFPNSPTPPIIYTKQDCYEDVLADLNLRGYNAY